MPRRSERLLHWPSRELLSRFVVLSALIAVLFVSVYAGTDYLTALHDWRFRLYLEAELALPLVPAMVLAYMSVYFGMLLALFVLPTRRELDALAAAMAAVIVLAGIAFVLLPAEVGFAPVAETLALTSTGTAGLFERILLLADFVNLDYNLIPSLHVALLTTCLGAYFVHAGAGIRLVFSAWIAVVSASTILTHQHHLIDIVAGIALGLLGARLALGRAGHLLRSGDRRPTR